MQRLHPILHRLRSETGLDIRLVYDTNQPAREEGPIRYTEWSVQRWDRVLSEADVGVAIKPLEDPFQQRKSTAKVVSYMAAGLPVVCTPSEADRRVIAHGKTGFFANHDHEWYDEPAGAGDGCVAAGADRRGRPPGRDGAVRRGSDRGRIPEPVRPAAGALPASPSLG